ncbi:MAG TPA: DUF1697 domain-containing protein [Rhodanobacteraceae bacterium]
METFVALLRGINVGGRSRLPMKDLVAVLEGLGAKQIMTYIQSGNVVFQATEKSRVTIAGQLAPRLEAVHGFKPHVLILDSAAIARAKADNPFPEAEADPKNLHLGFLSAMPVHPELDALESFRIPSESFRLIGSVFYLHAPDGVGRSRLAAATERLLGVPMTDRNWNTVCKIVAMIG